jgi:large subunit ribosomal protein L25
MTMTIQAEKRGAFGKNANRRLRNEGFIPAILYGENTACVPLALNKKDIILIMKSDTRENTIFKVGFEGDVRDAMIKDLQIDPSTDELIHADLIQIAMDKLIRITVPVVPKGESVGVKTEGGFVDFITREVEIECLPKDIPDKIDVDISGLKLHQSLKVDNIQAPEGVRFISDPGTVLIMISLPHKEEEFPGEKPEGEGVVAEEAAEPEVIKKERAEKEEEEK